MGASLLFFRRNNLLQAFCVSLAILPEEPQILLRWFDEPEDLFLKQNHIQDAGTGKIYAPGGHARVMREQQIIPTALCQEPIFNSGFRL